MLHRKRFPVHVIILLPLYLTLLVADKACDTIPGIFDQYPGVNYIRQISKASDGTLESEDGSSSLIEAGYGKLGDSDVTNWLKLGENFLNSRQLDRIDTFFNNQYELDQKSSDMTVSQYIKELLGFNMMIQVTSHYFLHHYDSFQDIKRAAGPQVDQEVCLRQLEYLSERLIETKTDVNLTLYLETFGKSPSNIVVGNSFSVGSYEACKRMRIAVDGQGKHSATRYCVGSLRYKDWPADDPLDKLVALKTGLCLPEACDSLNYKNKFELIKRLSDYNARQQDLGDKMHLTAVYCPPDNKSELGAWWRSKPTLVIVGLTVLWLVALVAATIIDEIHKRKQRSEELQELTGKSEPEAAPSISTNHLERICRSLSIISNFKSLFSTGKSSLMEKGQNLQVMDVTDQPMKIVNLDILEGIKVLAALHITSGHVIMLSTLIMSNLRELGTSQSVAWTMSNSIPALAVNAFFSITGILTSYMMFKQDRSHAFIMSPVKWLAFILYRYMRIMPMYALVTLFCKHVARYAGDGPFWDYGTSSLAARRTCEQEPWAWTLLLGANFKSPLKHCIPSAWYLANDFQFFMVTPIFLVALYLRPRLGRALLILASIASYLSGVRSVFGADVDDLRPISQFKAHGFKVYVNFLHESYTHPHNRISAYLIGLLLGHLLFEYEQRRKCHLERVESSKARKEETTPGWSKRMTQSGLLFSFFVAVTIILTPSVSSRLTVSRESERYKTAICVPAYHLLCSAGVGIYVLLAATGHGNQQVNRFLSLKFWKPLSRLGLCVMLVNIEVIVYITHTSRELQYMDNHYLTSLMVMSVIYTYIVATTVYVLFEAPLQSTLNYCLSNLMNRSSEKSELTKKSD